MKEKLLIIGASGHGKVLADIAKKMNKWQTISFVDDNEKLRSVMGMEVIGNMKVAFKLTSEYEIFVGIGNNTKREILQKKLETEGAVIPTLIHPNAVIGENVRIGSGSAIMAGAIINCCTRIGKGCIINTASTVDHDNLIGDYVHLSPGSHTAGTVRIGRGSWLGVGSIVSNNTNIAKYSIIGAGTVIVKNITISGTYVGVPARMVDTLKIHKTGEF